MKFIQNHNILIAHIFFGLCLLISASGCTKTEYATDYWNNNLGEKENIKIKCTFRNKKLDGYCYRFYRNGQLMSKAIYKKDHLVEIISVFDTLGRKLDFGELDEDGTGYVITYSDRFGSREHSGYYINGRREGWWKNYTYRGELTDSVFYIDSRPEFLERMHIVMY